MLQNTCCSSLAPKPLNTTTITITTPITQHLMQNTSQDGIESDDDCFADNEEDEFNTDPFDKNRDSGDSEDEVYT